MSAIAQRSVSSLQRSTSAPFSIGWTLPVSEPPPPLRPASRLLASALKRASTFSGPAAASKEFSVTTIMTSVSWPFAAGRVKYSIFSRAAPIEPFALNVKNQRSGFDRSNVCTTSATTRLSRP